MRNTPDKDRKPARAHGQKPRGIPVIQWNDWHWQLDSSAYPPGPGADAKAWRRITARYPAAATPYYRSLIRPSDPDDPILQLCQPHTDELRAVPGFERDPFGETDTTGSSGWFRRYGDRVVMMATTACAVRCRHCTRKNTLNTLRPLWSAARLCAFQAWLSARPQIREVLISGGDPLLLETRELMRLLDAVRAVPGIEILRIGTRVPVVLPQRVTPELCRALKSVHPLWLNTHFNHPAELAPAAEKACARLAAAGIPLGNQTVLLRGINDREETLESLFRGLLRLRVRPYYLLQCDPVRGTAHFRVPLSRGLELMSRLRGKLSGLAIPQFVVDVPGGGGKVPLLPETVVGREGNDWILQTPDGRRIRYPDALPGPAAASAPRGPVAKNRTT
jgi:lysine 2,3-aminomutase